MKTGKSFYDLYLFNSKANHFLEWEDFAVWYTSGRRITQTASGLDYQWTLPSSLLLLQHPPTYWLSGEPTPSLKAKDACLELRVSRIEAGIATSPCNTSKFVICDNSNSNKLCYANYTSLLIA